MAQGSSTSTSSGQRRAWTQRHERIYDEQVRKPASRQPPAFNGRDTLRRAGMTARQTGELGARGARAGASSAGFDASGWGSLLLYLLSSIVLLALLKTMLEGRGPAAVEKSLGFLGGAWDRFFSPVDPIIGQGPASPATADTAAAAGAATVGSLVGSAYVSPLAGIHGVTRSRIDQGLDLEAGAQNVGKPIRFLGNATVVAITSDPSGFGRYVAYRLNDGAAKGRVVYVGHSAIPAGVHVGQSYRAGQTVAIIKGLGPGAQPGHIEMGWADPRVPTRPLAQAGVASAGSSFAAFLQTFGL
ncbi:MAG TPA: hypothetical protein VIM33_04890 [Gaiellaceae bacterium]